MQSPAPAPNVVAEEPTFWEESWNEQTIQIAFEESSGLQQVHYALADASDKKAVAVFSVASVIIGLAPALDWGVRLSGLARLFWIAALLAWAIAVVATYFAVRPGVFRIEPDPKTLLTSAWLKLTPTQYRCFAMRDMAKTHHVNLNRLEEKADALGIAILFSGAEILSLALAFLAR